MTIDPNSIMAYYETEESRQSKREIIYKTVKKAQHPSSADIERLTGISRTCVTGRLRELEEDGLIRKEGTKIDPFTRKTVNYYVVVE